MIMYILIYMTSLQIMCTNNHLSYYINLILQYIGYRPTLFDSCFSIFVIAIALCYVLWFVSLSNKRIYIYIIIYILNILNSSSFQPIPSPEILPHVTSFLFF